MPQCRLVAAARKFSILHAIRTVAMPSDTKRYHRMAGARDSDENGIVAECAAPVKCADHGSRSRSLWDAVYLS
jgi:hypothetical protein